MLALFAIGLICVGHVGWGLLFLIFAFANKKQR